jgi:hypothetical protein
VNSHATGPRLNSALRAAAERLAAQELPALASVVAERHLALPAFLVARCQTTSLTRIPVLERHWHLCIFFAGGSVQTFVWNRIAGEVDQHLPENEQYSLSRWSFWRSAWASFNWFRIWRSHRRLFPDSYLRLWYVTTGVLTVFGMFFGFKILNGIGAT